MRRNCTISHSMGIHHYLHQMLTLLHAPRINTRDFRCPPCGYCGVVIAKKKEGSYFGNCNVISMHDWWSLHCYGCNTWEQAWSSIRKKCFGTLNHTCFGQTLKNNSKLLFRLDSFFHGALYCCVRYSNIEHQDEMSTSLSLKVLLKKEWLKLVLDIDFMILYSSKLVIFLLIFSLHIPWIHYNIEGIITKKLACFRQIFENYVFNISTCTLLAASSKICIFSWFVFNISCLAL